MNYCFKLIMPQEDVCGEGYYRHCRQLRKRRRVLCWSISLLLLRIMYAARDITGTVANNGLIVASIIGKKVREKISETNRN